MLFFNSDILHNLEYELCIEVKIKQPLGLRCGRRRVPALPHPLDARLLEPRSAAERSGEGRRGREWQRRRQQQRELRRNRR